MGDKQHSNFSPQETDPEGNREDRSQDALLTPLYLDDNSSVFGSNPIQAPFLESDMDLEDLMFPPTTQADTNQQSNMRWRVNCKNNSVSTASTTRSASTDSLNRNAQEWLASPARNSVQQLPSPKEDHICLGTRSLAIPSGLNSDGTSSPNQRSPSHAQYSTQYIKDTERKMNQLFNLHTTLYHSTCNPSMPGSTTTNNPAASLSDAYNLATTLIEIIRSIYSPVAANSAHSNLHQSGTPIDPHGSLSRTHSSHQDFVTFVLLGKDSSDQLGYGLPHPDPTIVFLILGCYQRLMNLYEQLVQGVYDQVLATNSVAAAAEGSSEKPPSAMLLVQTVSSVAHLADRTNDAVRLMAPGWVGDGIGIMGGTFGADSGMSGDGDILWEIAKAPIRSIEEQIKRLNKAFKKVTELIRQSSVI
jgi:hypothetical protein